MTRRASPGLSRLLLLGLAFLAFAPAVAKAQSGSYYNREELSTVRGRARPEYQAQGVDLGGFQLLPSLTVVPEYDDNIYATNTGKDSDLITAVTGAVQARSQWSRHEADAYATVTTNAYADHSGEDTTDYAIGGSGRLDILAVNPLGRALYAPAFDDPVRPANTARFTFLSPQGREFYRDWDHTSRDMVAILRAAAGRNPYDKALSDLIGELSTRSELFRTMWATHDVLFHRTGRKNLHHPVAGDLDLTYEAFELPAEPGLTMVVYTAEPDTPTAEALGFLASWAATFNHEETRHG